MLTAEFLSRLQFAFTISFHILFPAFSIGLATFLTVMEGLYLKTKNPLYLSICKFWMKIFALTFGMGVVSGVVMEFQLGTNWSGFTDIVGPVLGSLFTYEVLTAFFIEAGFLGVMIFGWHKVGPKLHFLSTLLVFLGVTLSGFWILSANSWMQVPAGAIFEGGRFVVDSWMEVIFNPMVIPRYLHMMLAAYLTTMFVIAGISAFYLLRDLHRTFAKKCLSFAMGAIIILIPVQIFVGDDVGVKVQQHQPLKTAAMEAVWETQEGAPLVLFAIPSMEQEKNLYAIEIPHLASLLNTHEWNGKLVGLKSVPPEDRAFVPIVFFSFRIMVAVGLLMFAMGVIGVYLRFKKRLYDTRWFLRLCEVVSPIGFVAIITGWFTAEAGRQPWVVYNMIRTSDAASHVDVNHVITSFVLLIIVYGLVFGVFYFHYLKKIIKAGPQEHDVIEKPPFAYMPGEGKEEQ